MTDEKTRLLPVKMTPEECAIKAHALAVACQEIENAEVDMKEEASEAKSRIKMQGVTASTEQHRPSETEDAEYQHLLGHVRAPRAPGPLFTTSATDLFATFIDALPEGRRQHYQCRECARFMERYGGLVTIDMDGLSSPLFWSPSYPSPGIFRRANHALCAKVAHARITGIFLSSDIDWGTEGSDTQKAAGGRFHHFFCRQLTSSVYQPTPLKNAAQAMAEKHEDRGMLGRALADFSIDDAQKVVHLLSGWHLARTEKFSGMAKWFLEIHQATGGKKGTAKNNLLWSAVASAPVGFAHIRGTVVGTLLEDVKAGLPFSTIKRKFDEKTAPLQYARPQVGPTLGQIEAAEAIAEKLGIGPSLARRYARLEDVERYAIWRPSVRPEVAQAGGVFGHLKPNAEPKKAELVIPDSPVTWRKFREAVLSDPNVVRLQFVVQPFGTGPYFAFVTAEHADSPPILQWDAVDRRNPVNWYLYHGGSPGHRWNVSFVADVKAITMQPNTWESKVEHAGDGAYFILDGCRDLTPELGGKPGLALFPDEMRSELHGIRSVIEASSRDGVLSGAKEASACGVCMKMRPGPTSAVLVLRATHRNGLHSSYRLTGWE